MRLKLFLTTNEILRRIPINYQYPLSSAIYKILYSSDAAYSSFLHNLGYRQNDSLKTFKFFTFSDLKTKFKIDNDRLILLSNEAELIICFHIPKAAEHFISGIFKNQRMELADQFSKTVFSIQQIVALKSASIEENATEINVKPISPLVTGYKNEKGNYVFLSPLDKEFISSFIYSWKEKFITLYGREKADETFKATKVEIEYYRNPPKSRLITIKAFTPEEIKIRGFTNFKLKIKAKQPALELLFNIGGGVYNSMGMGCLDIIENDSI